MFMGNRVSLAKKFPECQVIFSKGYQYVSGFVGFPSGKWVYFCSTTFNGGRYYARTAKNEKDFTGGMNNFTKSDKKEELFELILSLSTQEHIPT